jgi:hypothetical protein
MSLESLKLLETPYIIGKAARRRVFDKMATGETGFAGRPC